MCRVPCRRNVIPAIIVVATCAAFAAVMGNGFVEWGDRGELLDNVHYRGFGWANLSWMFTTIHQGHYQPLTWLSFAADYAMWGMRPAGYHATSLVLHCVCAVVAYLIILRLLGPGALVAAALAALLFALHPLRVEAVAWATERRGPLSSALALSSVLAYLYRARWLSVALFGLALLAKEFVFTLPLVLVILDVYPLRRRAWREKIPFFVLGALGAAVAIASSAHSGVARSLAEYGVLERVAQCFYGLAFYLEKTILPTGLSPIYSIPPELDPFAMRYVVSAIVVIGLTAGLVAARRRFPAALAAWVVFVVILSPVLGLAQTGHQIAADRYTYLPAVAVSALVGSGLVKLGRAAPMAMLPMLPLLAALALLTWKQVGVWRDPETLWRHAVRVDPNCHISRNNLEAVLGRSGRCGLQEPLDALEVRNDLGGEREREGLARLDPGHLGGPDAVGPLAPGPGADDVVVDTTAFRKVPEAALRLRLHVHEPRDRLELGRTPRHGRHREGHCIERGDEVGHGRAS